MLTEQQVRVFIEYTRKFEEIASELPDEARLLHECPADKGKYDIPIVRYINLCAEERFLFLGKAIPNDLWEVWRAGMQAYLGIPKFRSVWEAMNKQTYTDDFVDFMDEIMKE